MTRTRSMANRQEVNVSASSNHQSADSEQLRRSSYGVLTAHIRCSSHRKDRIEVSRTTLTRRPFQGWRILGLADTGSELHSIDFPLPKSKNLAVDHPKTRPLQIQMAVLHPPTRSAKSSGQDRV